MSQDTDLRNILRSHWRELKELPREFYVFYRFEVPHWLKTQVFTKRLKPIEDLSEEQKDLYRKLRTQASDVSEADKIRKQVFEGVA